MRIAVAALLAAIVIFIWQAIAHMVLPIGEMGFRQPTNEDAVLQAASTSLTTPGIYYLPSIDPNKMNDEATVKAWGEKAKKNPYVWAVVNTPPEGDPMSMGPQLVKQFITVFLAALLVAYVLAATAWGFGARVVGSLSFGVFGWLANIVPLWTWYRFPSDFIVGNLLEEGIGWLLGGVAIAWWLGRK
ncbi:MAG TPA: hypothetical protein VKB52_10715 [Rhodanobacteraceae bacterium]|nr:hypothetical protein [Rhodanobacteraceae bacterium]